MTKLGSRGDEGLEEERPERATVVGDQGDRDNFAGVGIGQVLDQRLPMGEQPLGLGQRQLDGLDRLEKPHLLAYNPELGRRDTEK